MSVEYIGLYLNHVKLDDFIKLCDTLNFHKAEFPISELAIKSTIKILTP